MSNFTLDTSGAVKMRLTNGGDCDMDVTWPDLSPFEQGYVEELLRALNERLALELRGQAAFTDFSAGSVGFSDLAASTLAAIRKDCAAFVKIIHGDAETIWEICARLTGWVWSPTCDAYIHPDEEDDQGTAEAACFIEGHETIGQAQAQIEARAPQAGRFFWESRNDQSGARGFMASPVWPDQLAKELSDAAGDFPPQTVTLGDDGRVYLREA